MFDDTDNEQMLAIKWRVLQLSQYIHSFDVIRVCTLTYCCSRIEFIQLVAVKISDAITCHIFAYYHLVLIHVYVNMTSLSYIT